MCNCAPADDCIYCRPDYYLPLEQFEVGKLYTCNRDYISLYVTDRSDNTVTAYWFGVLQITKQLHEDKPSIFETNYYFTETVTLPEQGNPVCMAINSTDELTAGEFMAEFHDSYGDEQRDAA